jgi:MinD superfamily P-loop ATPase
MKQIAVISGKGGTGKTSITASFVALAKDCVIVDADVDASDLHLLFHPEVKMAERFFAGEVAVIEPKLCDRGKKCEPYCRYGAIIFDTAKDFYIDSTACEGCGVCARICHTKAIRMEGRDCGEWYSSSTIYGPMLHARLGIGGENSGKLVALLREKAREISEKENFSFIIIDGPPGVGCPVMATITGVDIIVAVAEPTVSGRHDLHRVIHLARHFGIPLVVIINKWDINPEMSNKLKKECEAHKVEVIGEIPYDNDVIGAIVHGETLVDFSDGPAAIAVSNAWEKLSNMIVKMDRK